MYLAQQVVPSGLSGAKVALYEKIGEGPDNLVQNCLAAAGRGGANDHFVVPGITPHQPIEPGKRGVEAAHPVLFSHLRKPADDFFRHREFMTCFGEGMHRGTRAIQWQFNRLKLATQLMRPIKEQGVASLSGQLPLPGSVIRILN